MTGEDILKSLFKKIHNHYSLAIADFNDLVDIGSTDDIIDILIATPQITAMPNIRQLVNELRTANIGVDFLNDLFIVPVNVTLVDFSQNIFEKRHRPFSYADTDFGFLSLKKLFQIIPTTSLSLHPIDFKILLDYISTLVQGNRDPELISILIHIEQGNKQFGILIEKTINGASDISKYSYVYYKKLLSGDKIELDSGLKYHIPHGAVTNFNATILYQQYFEIFDIVNELNHAEDLITRFLKIYHIIEYLMYRVELVKLEVKARTNRSFIMDIHSLTGQKTAEFEVLKKNFAAIFNTELHANDFDLGALTQDQCEFLERYWGLKYTATFTIDANVKNITNLIYGIRNSIVHNKESQFHLTTSNPEDYEIVIPVIKRFIPALERAILNKVSNNEPVLSYQQPYIQLY